MILFICEGEGREPRLLDAINNFFLSEHTDRKDAYDAYIVSWGCHIWSLASQVKKYSEGFSEIEIKDIVDIVALLKEQKKNKPKDSIHQVKQSSDISQIYLFFDFDPQNNEEDLSVQLSKIDDLLRLFDNERIGMLYISYPMIEAICYTEALPSRNFYEYVCSIDACRTFKGDTPRITGHKNHDAFLARKSPKGNKTRPNWSTVIQQHRRKAQLLCSVGARDSLTQRMLFHVQCDKYIKPREEMAVLASIPLFLYDYFDEEKRKEFGFSIEEGE